ncbi:MAG: cation-translocating P-type ATPase [Firmicutes bacterium]|nr:cation-translocating P-type ATPase [Bacillota bacterium]
MKENYWQQSSEELLAQFESRKEGLSSAEIATREEKYGKNRLEEAEKKSTLMIFLEQFKDLLVVILIAAAIISMVSGNVESTIVIFVVLIINAVLGTAQTLKAEKSLEALKQMSSPHAKVIRDGAVVEIDSADIVPGDILTLEAGDLIGADGRIIENFGLKSDESSLTGESEPAEKTDAVLEGDEIPLGDRKNMVYSGSLVTYGRANVLVTSTGMNTEIGKIATLMNETKQRKTPLQVSLDKFSAKLATGIIIICVIVFFLSIFRSQMSILDSLMFAVALAVAAIPEALASIVSIVLAIGTQKMAKQNAIIKNLNAVESLGCVSVICSDKTGTLTQNKMTVQKLYVDGKEFLPEETNLDDVAQRALVRIGILASDAVHEQGSDRILGDPTEAALVMAGNMVGLDEVTLRNEYPRLGELAFDSDRKMMSTLHRLYGVPMMLTKGALDQILNRCDSILTEDGVILITERHKEAILAKNEEFSKSGLRVLSFAQREMTGVNNLTLEDENHLTFVGLVAMMDPPREESIQAVADAAKGGIRTVMITGDHKITAQAIATQIGIFREGDMALEGVELEHMNDDELDAVLEKVSVYARVSPEHKIRIVNAWQRKGKIVSMTGDGVNDAPALKKADIGVAMGITGTEVSKDASSMILVDDNFATIVQAVVNGRGVYTNIRNAIQFLLSGNMAAILSVLFASVMALPAPFAPVHLLFINLLTDSLPAIACGMEPARKGLLEQKPRDPKESILNKDLITKVMGQGLLIAVPTMIAFYIGYAESAAVGSTMAFATLSLARLFHGFNCRAKESIFKLGFRSNPFSLLAFVTGIVLLFSVLLVPGLDGLFLVEGVNAARIGAIVGLAFVPTLLIQIYKVFRDLAKK